MSRTYALSKSLLLLVIALPPTLACAESGWGTRETMADAMVRMMEAMGMFSPSPGSAMPYDPMATTSPFGGPPWVPGQGGFGMPRITRGEEMMRRFAPGASSLEGVWEGRNGELVIVQGKRFRIYSSSGGQVDGFVRVQDSRLAMYVPGEEQARPFEFSESGGRLVLRDGNGQMYFYRRLRLDSLQPRSPLAAPGR